MADHGGWDLGQKIYQWLLRDGYRVVDLSSHRRQPNDDYPKLALRLARRVVQNKNSLGLAICRTGTGMAIAANKVAGVRAATASSSQGAKRARYEENINILCLGADFTPWRLVPAIVQSWLKSPRSRPWRYQRRLQQLMRLDHAR